MKRSLSIFLAFLILISGLSLWRIATRDAWAEPQARPAFQPAGGQAAGQRLQSMPRLAGSTSSATAMMMAPAGFRSIINPGFEQPGTPTNTVAFFCDASGACGPPNLPGWRTTATDSQIEVWGSGYSNLSPTIPAAEGINFAELNANQPSGLYQDVCMLPGETFNYSLKHRGRRSSSTPDQMFVKIGPVGSLATNATFTDTNSAWGTHTGSYTNSGSAQLIRYQFEAGSTAGSNSTIGNFLDNIQITGLTPFVEFESAIYAGPENSVNAPKLLVNGLLISPQTVTLQITGGTATSGQDFTLALGVSIPAGNYDGTAATAVPINLSIINDATLESPNETINIGIQSVSPGLAIASTQSCGGTPISATVYTILNDDASVGACQALGGTLAGGNLFTAASNGAFGTGTGAANASAGALPANTIPGYSYQTYGATTPIDGGYTVVNNVQTAAFGPWHIPVLGNTTGLASDNFLIVNGSVFPGIFFEQTIAGLTPNTNYQFSTFVGNLCQGCERLPNLSFETVSDFGVIPRLSTGNVAETAAFTWTQQGFVFNTGPSTSITFRLRNNTAGGAATGNDLTLDDIGLQQCAGLPSGTVAGRVYSDEDRNDAAGANEPGLANIEVRLIDNGNNAVIGLVETDASGNFTFSNTPVGNYTARVRTNDPDLPAGAAPGTSNALIINVTNGGTTTANFGFDLAADLAINKNGPGTAPAATNIAYALTVSNNGPGGALNVPVSDTVDARLSGVSWNCAAPTGGAVCGAGASGTGNNVNAVIQRLPAGGSVTLLVNGLLSASAGGTLENTAIVSPSGGVADPNSDNNSSTAGPVPVVCPNIMLTPFSLPSAIAGESYSQTLAAQPAGGNYGYAVITGFLPPGLTLNAATSAITGAPAQSGVFNFRVTATGFAQLGGCASFQDYQIHVTGCAPIQVNPATLSSATVGTSYTQTVGATPAGAHHFVVTSGALPPGLTLNAATGAISGTPTLHGAFNFRIAATLNGCAGVRDYTLTVNCETISISPASLPAAPAGFSYSQSLSAAPAAAYVYSLAQGNLPSGLTLNPQTGLLSGLPAVAGTFNFAVRAQVANGCGGVRSYTLTVNCPTVVLSGLTVPQLNSPYSQTVTASPAGGNYSFAITAGNPPPGFTLNPATGLMTGTAALVADYEFTITATGFGGCAASRTYHWPIGAHGNCPTITLPALPNGSPGQFYNHSVTASPAGNYSYTLDGSLPAGLTFYNAFGLIYGYPTAAGSFSFTVTARDLNNCAGSKNYTLLIGGAGVVSSVFGDFDGDGKADFSVWRGKQGAGLIVNSGDGREQIELLGASDLSGGDVTVAGDYDGDGKTDLAVFRRGGWLIKSSRDGAIRSELWGLATDTPVPGDYDGDGKTDIAVWRGAQGHWYIRRSSDQQIQTVLWGTSNAPYRDLPVPADFDGDGKTDIAVFRQASGKEGGHWYIKQSSDGQVIDKLWGLGTDVPVAADYDGDGKADIAVWRGADTNWYIVRSSDGAVQSASWGTSSLGDVPVPGDYDGDGRTDMAVWRVREGNWYVKLSSANAAMTKAFGQPGDKPVAAR